jgi:hypothetical protein
LRPDLVDPHPRWIYEGLAFDIFVAAVVIVYQVDPAAVKKLVGLGMARIQSGI